jgi:hypothetical protein
VKLESTPTIRKPGKHVIYYVSNSAYPSQGSSYVSRRTHIRALRADELARTKYFSPHFILSSKNKMLISGSILYSAAEKYQRVRRIKERYSEDSVATPVDGAAAAFSTFTLLVAIVFLMLEILLLFYAIGIAITCSTPGAERIVHLVLATTFTLPYMLLNTILSGCAKQRLRTGLFVPSGSSTTTGPTKSSV